MELKDILNQTLDVVNAELHRQETDSREKLLLVQGATEGVRYFLQILDEKLKELVIEQQDSKSEKPEKPSRDEQYANE